MATLNKDETDLTIQAVELKISSVNRAVRNETDVEIRSVHEKRLGQFQALLLKLKGGS